MKKIKLNLDELKVESFETVSEKNTQRGTLQGQQMPDASGDNGCGGTGGGGGSVISCFPYGNTCQNTCGQFTCWYGVGDCGSRHQSCIDYFSCGHQDTCGISHCCTGNHDIICLASNAICAPPTCGFLTF